MPFTGISSLDHGIDTVNALLTEAADEFGPADRRFAYLVTPALAARPAGPAAGPGRRSRSNAAPRPGASDEYGRTP
jgi:hypothetical protein